MTGPVVPSGSGSGITRFGSMAFADDRLIGLRELPAAEEPREAHAQLSHKESE